MQYKDNSVQNAQPRYRVPFVSLRSAQKDKQFDTILKRIREMYENSQFILGPQVEAFEQSFAQLAGCAHAVGVNSGTDAMILALRALGVGAGDEVITVANSFIASVSAVSLCGATPVLVDVAADYNMDPDALEKAINAKTKAVIVVHLTGMPCRMDRIEEICAAVKVPIIEDAAQAVGATWDGKRVGGIGKVGCFSLHPLKNLHVWGDGGVATTNDPDLAERLRKERNHGLKNRDEVEFFSFNSRLDSVQAIVGLSAVEMLPDVIAQRRKNAALYDSRLRSLKGYLEIPVADPKAFATYHLYVVAAERREALRDHLDKSGVETKIHYPIPAHLQEAARALGIPRGSLPVTEALANKILSLPIHENLQESQILEVCDLIEHFYQRGIA
ncbi:MAG: DegT/DnrJ/EryC1/StrS family aminotransferase [Bdellovibrionaceae bacterium]|nr:DegT/DnrJ/EryC1/StrS family aminotransferase [Bdellovibrionales bacterium]MCB9253490.1 DegT/DnrJ/EryC1/StrS family aminotransferase [Pseudobdellovibrionaceae bacterium]